MISFVSHDTFEVEGRGTIKVVKNNRDRHGNFDDLYPEVMVDGKNIC